MIIKLLKEKRGREEGTIKGGSYDGEIVKNLIKS
jgi:hypothetical protein